MRWSAARKHFDALLAPSVASHVELHATRYHGAPDQEGRGWITWDGRELKSFSAYPFLSRRYDLASSFQGLGQGVEEAYGRGDEIAEQEGFFDYYRFLDAVEAYPSLAIRAAVNATDPIIRALAMLDRRLGKRRLASMEFSADEQPFVVKLHALRCEAEGLAPTSHAPGHER